MTRGYLCNDNDIQTQLLILTGAQSLNILNDATFLYVNFIYGYLYKSSDSNPYTSPAPS